MLRRPLTERRYYYLTPQSTWIGTRLGFQYLVEEITNDEIEREARIIVADALTTFGIDFGLGMNIALLPGFVPVRY